MKSAAIAIVRNAVDIAPLTVLHHWLLGCDRVWIIDNGSSDGTYEALLTLQSRLPGLRVERNDGPFDQASWTSDMANALLREGYDLIIPFDADECWNVEPAAVIRSMRQRGAFQEMDFKAFFGSTAKWVCEIDDPARIPELV